MNEHTCVDKSLHTKKKTFNRAEWDQLRAVWKVIA